MANCCLYTARAVAKSKEVLDRLVDILRYRDKEYCCYRVSSADVTEGPVRREDGLWVVEIQGDSAHDAQHLFANVEDTSNVLGKYATTPGTENAHVVTLDILAKRLGFAIEVWSEESGCCFQEHIVCGIDGVPYYDSVDWYENWEDDEGNELDEPIVTGGYSDYLSFRDPSRLFGSALAST